MQPWLRSSAAAVGVFTLLAAFAWHGTNSRFADMTTLLVAIPAGAFILLLLAAACWTLFARVPFASGLAFATRIFPLAWIVPLVDMIRSGGVGVAAPSVALGATDAVIAAATGTLLPMDLALPIGMRVGVFSAALVTAFVVWFVRKHLLAAAASFAVMSVALVKLITSASLLGAAGAVMAGRGWVADPADLARETIRAVTNGYWWNNLYDRFPSAVEPQADIAIRLTAAAVVVLALGIVLLALFVWRVRGWKRLTTHALRAWSAADLALYAAGGGVITALLMRVPPVQGTWWIACALAVLSLAAFRLHMMLERCLHHAASGLGDGSDPVACGDVPPQTAADLSRIALIYALATGFMLGWPVFAALLAAVAASVLSRDRLWTAWPLVATIFRSAGASALAAAGFFFVSQGARLTGAAALVMVLAAAHRSGLELFWPRRKG